MAMWPAADQNQMQSSANTANSRPYVTATASATPNTKGSWVEIITTSAFEAEGILIASQVQIATAATDSSMLLDIGLGAIGSERVLVSNIPYGHTWWGQRQFFPIRIPSGERVAVRVQSAIASKADDFTCELVGGSGNAPLQCGGVATTYGASTATSNGVALTDGGVANVKNSWTQITSSTTRPIRWLVPVLGGTPANTNFVVDNCLVDIGIGGAGSEAVLLPNLPVSNSAGEDLRSMSSPYPIAVNVPAGTRLSARFQQSAAPGQAPTVTLIGID
jgi:hypothetical protein